MLAELRPLSTKKGFILDARIVDRPGKNGIIASRCQAEVWSEEEAKQVIPDFGLGPPTNRVGAL